MDFRRSGQLDGRRRRVLMDTSNTGDADKDDPKPASSGARGPVRAYAPAVLEDRQPRLTDLIPRRAFVLVMLALLGLTGIATIEAVYIHLYPMLTAGATLPGLDLSQRGSLSSWFSSLMLFAGAAIALVVYSMRVHRVDDYRGRYRVWLWTSATLVVASFAAATGIHQTLNSLCLSLTGMAAAGAGGSIWLAAYAVLFGGVGLWLAIELWPSVESFSTLAVAATLYVAAALADLGLLPLQGTLLSVVVQSTLVMLAHGTLVYSLTLYARHVHLDAQGRLTVKVERAKRKKKSAAKLSVVGSDETAEPKRKRATAEKAAAAKTDAGKGGAAAAEASGSAQPTPKPAGASITAATLKSPPAKPLAVAGGDSDEDDEDGGEKLSRAERRRLKKLAQQGDGHEQQRRAA